MAEFHSLVGNQSVAAYLFVGCLLLCRFWFVPGAYSVVPPTRRVVLVLAAAHAAQDRRDHRVGCGDPPPLRVAAESVETAHGVPRSAGAYFSHGQKTVPSPWEHQERRPVVVSSCAVSACEQVAQRRGSGGVVMRHRPQAVDCRQRASGRSSAW